MQVVDGQVTGFDGKLWQWMCGNDKCHARTNPPVAIKGRQRVTAVCKHCKAINQVSRFR